ncbi:MAG TPA: MFS transporter [Ilumatobacteraceae bacterium]|nr:MFS transporter [Ilumatobacteraceae bacterium]
MRSLGPDPGDDAAASRSRLDELDSALAELGIDTTQLDGPRGGDVPTIDGAPAHEPGPERGPDQRRGGRSRFGAPLPRNFRLLWGATALSNLGDGLRLVAMPLLATSVTSDPRLIAGVTVAQRLPWLFFILPGGAWADRFDRRLLRMRIDIARALVMSVLVAAIVLDQTSIVVIYVVAALLASAEAVVDSSSMAMVPATVERPDLERAVARLGSTELAMNDLVGPPLGGLLFGLAIAVPFGIDAATFVGAALVMGLVSGQYRPAAAAPESGDRSSMRASLAEGIRWLWNQRLLRTLALVSTALGTASFVGTAVFVIFATETLELSEFGYGLLLVPGALGGIAGSLIAPRFRRFPLRRTLPIAVVGSGASTWLMAVASSPIVVGALSAVSLGSVMVWNVLTLALRQRVIPDEMLGRVGASYRFLVYLGMPFGALAGGLLANEFGVRSAIFVSGSVLVSIGLLLPCLLRDVERYET